jgi:hypothetical protein
MQISKKVRNALKAGTTMAATPSGDPYPPIVF